MGQVITVNGQATVSGASINFAASRDIKTEGVQLTAQGALTLEAARDIQLNAAQSSSTESRKDELWWYVYGHPVKHPLEKGSYFGRWCIEAVAAVKAFGLDDSLCLGHEHYPGDLLRPNRPSTHPQRPGRSKSLFTKVFGGKAR